MSETKKRKDKTICIGFPDEIYYESCMADKYEFRAHVDYSYEQYPQVFPPGFEAGYVLNGKVKSKKQQIEMRRIKLIQNNEVYLVRPSFLLPYMTGRTDEVEKALYLKRWGVPFEALAYIFGRNGMYWYRIYIHLGQYSLVGTTIKDAAHLPADLIADEKHTRLQGERVYLATTVAQECILGAELAQQADTYCLTKAYATFQQEAQQLEPTYQPETVNTDGWTATRNAWKLLFPSIQIILCFLHGFLAIRDSCRASKDPLKQILN